MVCVKFDKANLLILLITYIVFRPIYLVIIPC